MYCATISHTSKRLFNSFDGQNRKKEPLRPYMDLKFVSSSAVTGKSEYGEAPYTSVQLENKVVKLI